MVLSFENFENFTLAFKASELSSLYAALNLLYNFEANNYSPTFGMSKLNQNFVGSSYKSG